MCFNSNDSDQKFHNNLREYLLKRLHIYIQPIRAHFRERLFLLAPLQSEVNVNVPRDGERPIVDIPAGKVTDMINNYTLS